MVVIIQDHITQSLLLLSVALMLYFVFVTDMISLLLYPFILLLGCVIIRIYINKKVTKDVSIEEKEMKKTIYCYLVALTGIFIGSIFVSNIYDFLNSPAMSGQLIVSSLSFSDKKVFGVLMAIIEEQFFRGEILEWTGMMATPRIGIIVSTVMFSVYHLGVYGTDLSSVMYVFVGGISLGWAAVTSGRLAPASLAHITNNVVFA